jgi:hypothetical protein
VLLRSVILTLIVGVCILVMICRLNRRVRLGVIAWISVGVRLCEFRMVKSLLESTVLVLTVIGVRVRFGRLVHRVCSRFDSMRLRLINRFVGRDIANDFRESLSVATILNSFQPSANFTADCLVAWILDVAEPHHVHMVGMNANSVVLRKNSRVLWDNLLDAVSIFWLILNTSDLIPRLFLSMGSLHRST